MRFMYKLFYNLLLYSTLSSSLGLKFRLLSYSFWPLDGKALELHLYLWHKPLSANGKIFIQEIKMLLKLKLGRVTLCVSEHQ